MARTRKTAAAQAETQIEAQTEQVQLTAEAPKSKGLGVGALVKELIGQGLSTDDILAQVKEQFPAASTNRACVAWYRSDLKRRANNQAVVAQ